MRIFFDGYLLGNTISLKLLFFYIIIIVTSYLSMSFIAMEMLKNTGKAIKVFFITLVAKEIQYEQVQRILH